MVMDFISDQELRNFSGVGRLAGESKTKGVDGRPSLSLEPVRLIPKRC